MGFSSELCGPQGHGALQQLQEAELRLLEGMKKWMAQRVKSDREYAGLLHHMSLQDSGGQSWSGGPDSPVSQVSFRELSHPLSLAISPCQVGLELLQTQARGPSPSSSRLPIPQCAVVLGRDN